MKSYGVNDHGASDQVMGQAKKLWVTPSVQIIAIQSAQSGTHPASVDGGSGHFSHARS